MRDRMVHRGPDGAGVWAAADGSVGLAHRRLAIVDLSEAAAQPMENESGSVRVVFNGEIYNHAQLRPELERAGHRFRTDHSDTEVILHAYEEWGIDCIHRFRGMFAFALWDDEAGDLWLVRDRIGIKPLYWTVAGGRLLFASEIKALLAGTGVRAALEEDALVDYLSFLVVPAPRTLFEGIYKLPGGCRARVHRDGDVRLERWWDVWDETRSLEGADERELSRLLLDELRASVELRKMADVPVGIFLSGGIDSTTNAVLFAEHSAEPVRTFSIGYERDYASYRNEFDFAGEVARSIGALHHERRLTLEDVLAAMPLVIEHQDEPIADPVCVPVYYVSKLARDAGVIVCQVGEGSDELFCGYPEWRLKLRLQRAAAWPIPRALKRAGLAALRLAGRDEAFPYEWLRRDAAELPVFWGGAEGLPDRAKRRILVKRLRDARGPEGSWSALAPVRERYLERAPRPRDPFEWMAYLDLHVRLPELLLMRVDKMSMAASVECRVPFLDHRFVGLAMSIPGAVKTRGGQLKRVLKNAVRGVIPDRIIDRPKQGFGVPVRDWLTGRLGDEVRSTVLGFAGDSGVLDTAAVDSYLRRGQGDPWALYNLALWYQEYVA
jgi:asparagine synthase (glutamine-hydrolysing)